MSGCNFGWNTRVFIHQNEKYNLIILSIPGGYSKGSQSCKFPLLEDKNEGLIGFNFALLAHLPCLSNFTTGAATEVPSAH